MNNQFRKMTHKQAIAASFYYQHSYFSHNWLVDIDCIFSIAEIQQTALLQ